jgi:DinB superfamily
MDAPLPEDLQKLDDALQAAERDARALAAGLNEELGAWRGEPASWSVAECLDHLATANRVYLDAMRPAAASAQLAGQTAGRPARPGVIGGWFVRSLEPPVNARFRIKAPRLIRPRTAPPLSEALNAFLASHEQARAFLRTYASVDLTCVRFPNPFIPGVRFSLATGLHVIAAHERRHLWQGWRVRQAAEQSQLSPSGG